MAANRRYYLRAGFFALIILTAVTAWVPPLTRLVDNRRDAWRAKHSIWILYTTDTRSYLDSCKCEQTIIGTLAVRHGYFMNQRSAHPLLLLVDAGNAVEDTRRMGISHTAMAMARYDAAGTGEQEAKLGEAFARSAREHRLPLVRAVPRGDSTDALTQRIRIRRLGGHTLGITAAASPPEDHPYEAYRDRLVQAMRELHARCEVLVLLSQLGLKRDRDLARRCGEGAPNVIIGNADAEALTRTEYIGPTALVPTAPGGVRVGSLCLTFPWWGPPRVERAEWHTAVGPPEPTLEKRVKGYYQTAQKQFLRGIDPALLSRKMATGAGDVLRCGRCHERQAQQWQRTDHARAVDTLIRADRVLPECLPCHAVHYRDTGVFDHTARAGSVDCTGCHPLAAGGQPSRCPMKATATRGSATCQRCHNTIHNPTFDYLKYLLRIGH